MSRSILGLALLSTLALFACGSRRTGSAPKMPDGNRVAIMVHTTHSLPADAPADELEKMNQLSSWMESDLLAILDRTGYAGMRVEDPNVAAGLGRYVLHIHVKEYDAGSRAARMLVGFRAGAAVLVTHFELQGDGGASLLAGDPRVDSGGDGRHAARIVNLQTVDAVNTYLLRNGVISGVRALPPNASASAVGARARDEPAARREFEAGRDAYEHGDFADALTHFERAHALSARSKLLFNIGRAADSDGQASRAIDAYEAYLAASPDAENAKFVRARIAKMRALQSSQVQPVHERARDQR